MKNSLLAISILSLLFTPKALNAATIAFSTIQHGGTAGTLEISVFDGNSYINGDVASTALSNVVDYAFFHDSLATADLSGSSTVLPSSVSNSAASSSSSRQNIAFYTTNDPAASTPTPNATFNQHTVGSNNTLTGTFNFSTLPGGTANDVTIYLIHGGWNNFRNLTLTDGTDTWNHSIASGSAREFEYVTAINISDFSLSDSFTYSLSGSTNNPTFTGVIVTQTAIPEPSALLLSCFGLLLLVRRRR